VHQVLLFYKYVTIIEPGALAERFRTLMAKYQLLGRVIVASEGVNATMEGLKQNTEDFIKELFEDGRLADIEVKRSLGDGKSFPRTSVKVKEEIVSTKFDAKEVDPRLKTAPKLSPEELRKWYEEQRDFVVVDMRNDYEYISGHFKDSINLGLDSSRELPKALEKIEELKDKTVLTVCTGGIRCEKMSAMLQAKGFKDVYQLENGIHAYMEQYPGKDFLGTLYTFDDRKTMHFGGEREVIGTCHLCSAKTENYVNCMNDRCHLFYLLCEECQGGGKLACSDTCVEVLLTKKA